MWFQKALSFVAVLVCVWRPCGANAQEAEATGKVLFKYDETKITDGQLAKLAGVLASDLSKDDWTTVAVQRNDGLASIVDRYYKVYAQSSSSNQYAVSLPQTTSMLISLIKEANGDKAMKLVAGDTLKIPPMPVRPQSGAGVSPTVRAYDPKSASYALIQPGGRTSVQVGAGAKPIAKANPIRNATMTVMSLSADKLDAVSSLPGYVEDPQLVNVELLQGHKCVPADPLITTSPYYEAARARTVAALSRLETTAQQRHLALLDFDFQTDHGSRVFSAVEWLLDKFGVNTLSKSVDSVELNKSVAKDQLQQLLQAYRVYGRQYKLEESLVAFATLWTIDPEGSQVGTTIRTVPAVLMSAVMWQHLNRGSWLSLSWRIDSATSTQPLQLKNMIDSKGSFVAVAAGNESAEVRADLFPQSGASVFTQFVNVTYGAPNGTLFGSPTSAAGGGKVDLLAPGCGFTFKKLAADDEGSSFSTPLVAAAAWLKSLLDGTPAAQMRGQLVHASLLVPPVATPFVVSGGVFDPARLLAPMAAHYLDPTRTHAIPLDDVTVDAGACGTFKPIPAQPASQDLIVFQRSGKFLLLRRHDVQDFPGVHVEPECEVTSLNVTARGPHGVLNIASPAAFLATIGHLTF